MHPVFWFSLVGIFALIFFVARLMLVQSQAVKRAQFEEKKREAERGNAFAQLELGRCFMGGKGVARNPGAAVEWFRKAAEQGYAEAQNALGYAYETGTGVPQDIEKSIEWRRKAAEQGYVLAQSMLGILCKRMNEYAYAYVWFLIVATSENQDLSSHARKQLTLIEQLITPEQIIEARMAASAWLEKHQPTNMARS